MDRLWKSGGWSVVFQFEIWSGSDRAHFGSPQYAGAGRYSPPKRIDAIKNPSMGNPDPALVNTSFAERPNLTMRMRRFTRLTNAFSKKFENHCHALALYFVFYNFCRVHKTLGRPRQWLRGLWTGLMNMSDVVGLIDVANPRPFADLTKQPAEISN